MREPEDYLHETIMPTGSGEGAPECDQGTTTSVAERLVVDGFGVAGGQVDALEVVGLPADSVDTGTTVTEEAADVLAEESDAPQAKGKKPAKGKQQKAPPTRREVLKRGSSSTGEEPPSSNPDDAAATGPQQQVGSSAPAIAGVKRKRSSAATKGAAASTAATGGSTTDSGAVIDSSAIPDQAAATLLPPIPPAPISAAQIGTLASSLRQSSAPLGAHPRMRALLRWALARASFLRTVSSSSVLK
jgi:hypothetical protein